MSGFMENRSFSLGQMSEPLRRVALLIGLSAIYYFTAKLGLRFAFINSSVTTVWPPAGTVLAALLSTMVSATLGVFSLLGGGLLAWSAASRVWLTWWLGDAVGDIVIAPALILWIGVKPASTMSRSRVIEAIAAAVVTALVTFAIFGGLFPSRNYSLTVLLWPVMIWVAFRFGPREAATALLIISL